MAELVTSLGYPTDTVEMLDRLRVIAGREDFATFVCEASGDVIGVAGVQLGPMYERTGTAARLVILSVAPAWRRHGVGTRLLLRVEEWARAAGAVGIVAHSGAWREDAQAFYRRHGYEVTGVRLAKLFES